MTKPEITARLDSVLVKHLTWKPSTVRTIATRIVKVAYECNGRFSPEDIEVEDIPRQSVNCVGSAFRQLAEAGIIAKTGTFHQSKRKSSGGRTIFDYQLVSKGLANTFLERNGGGALGLGRQQELKF